MKVSLGNLSWKMMGHWPYAPIHGRSMETGCELQGVTKWIEARVPGCVQADLLRAGLIDDPYFERNSLKCEWVEHRWWQYHAEFTVPANAPCARRSLRFMGVDYRANFYLNGELLGSHEGMFDPVEFDVTGKLCENAPNRLDVLLFGAPEEFGQLGYTSRSNTQKSRFNYKWDFGTRLVHLGIWRDVELVCTGEARLADVFVSSTLLESGVGQIGLCGRIDGVARGARLTAVLDGVSYAIPYRARDGAFDSTITIEYPRIWQTNGLGAQPLYDLALSLADETGESDRFEARVGIRSLSYRRNEGADESALPYTLVLNGRPTYIKGVNMTPLDHMYGALTEADYRKTLTFAKNMGVNLIRVWGGGLIESEHFYNICDEFGILVWQEFIQSSSGLDNIPSKLPHFLRLLEIAATAALREKRNHVCHAVWSGGNELMDAEQHPSGYGDENIHLLKTLCSRLDPDKLFLPTSASGPNEWLRLDRPGVSHDVHGNWQYEGVRLHYERFNRSDSMLHSEFGANGLSGLKSLARIFDPERLRPISMRDDLVWRHHGEWWDCYARDRALFGHVPDDLGKWSLLSQLVQAEALRYALEANRARAFQNSGSIIWQFNEPWPNASCTSLLEYSGAPKLAWFAARKAFNARHLCLRYESWIQKAEDGLHAELILLNSLAAARLEATVRVWTISGEEIHAEHFVFEAAENRATPVGKLALAMPKTRGQLFVVELSLYDERGTPLESSRLLFSQAEEAPFAALLSLHETTLRAERVESGLQLTNTGDETAVLVRCAPDSADGSLLPEDDGLILFPRESRRVSLAGAHKTANLRCDALNAASIDI